MIDLLIPLAYMVVGAVVLYFTVRGAIVSALRHHAMWRADGTYDVELQRHLRDIARDAE